MPRCTFSGQNARKRVFYEVTLLNALVTVPVYREEIPHYFGITNCGLITGQFVKTVRYWLPRLKIERFRYRLEAFARPLSNRRPYHVRFQAGKAGQFGGREVSQTA